MAPLVSLLPFGSAVLRCSREDIFYAVVIVKPEKRRCADMESVADRGESKSDL
jgi:hypothetical protein